MNFSLENQGTRIIFTIKDKKINTETSSALKAQFLIVCQQDIDILILDLSNVEIIDSSGLGAFLLAHRQLKEYEIPIALVGVRGMVKSLLRISQIEHLFEYYDTVEDAIASVETEE